MPSGIDDPILFRSVINNVGFAINEKNIIPTLKG